ncbi:hypothetical protein KY361_03025, partial [Candidatus Woesearchaeota archaeon]|nr:hypothetical protein [Candidatus Woesearchaeota archaeon]
NGTYLVKYLYGSRVKEQLIRSLKDICIYFQIMTENFIIKHLGFNEVNKSFKHFKKAIAKNFNIDVSHLEDRFDVYINYFKTKRVRKV